MSDDRITRVSTLAVETFTIVQLQLQILSAIAGVFEQLNVEAPPAIPQLVLAINERTQALLPLIHEEVVQLTSEHRRLSSETPDTDSADIFGLSNPNE